MSTYAIADAIDRFAKGFKEVISEKNKIEREKLAFEKEKFEFNKQQLESSETINNKSLKNEFECTHNWVFDSVYDFPSDFSRKERYVCSICKKDKWNTIEYTFKT